MSGRLSQVLRAGRRQLTRSTRPYSTALPPEGKATPRLSSFLWASGLVGATGFTVWYWWSHSDSSKLPHEDVKKLVDTLNRPVHDKFLPDKVDDPKHPRPYTLVIDLDGFLVHHVWDYDLGRWRVAKRPGAELFLFYAAQLYEVVVFSSMQQYDGDGIVKKLDPFGCISYALYRFATRHERGRYIKDLSVLNRDPSRTVIIGHDVEGFKGNRENMLVVKPWTGDPNDRSLEETVDFLEGLALSRAKDIRPIVKQFSSDTFFFPASYDTVQADVFETSRKAALERLQSRQDSWLSKIFGFGGKSEDTMSALSKDYWAKKEERIQLRQKEWTHIRGLMQKQLEAELAKEKAYYAEHKMPLWDLFSKGPPPPPPTNIDSAETA